MKLICEMFEKLLPGGCGLMRSLAPVLKIQKGEVNISTKNNITRKPFANLKGTYTHARAHTQTQSLEL